ncbi:MAG: hypothetical protein ACKOW3_04920 [Hyphomicrobium sp.]
MRLISIQRAWPSLERWHLNVLEGLHVFASHDATQALEKNP